MTELETGQAAPQFQLPRDGGDILTLSDFAGKPIVLYFYPKDDTTACTQEAIDFTRLKPQFEQAEAVVIGMSPDSTKKHDKFKAKHQIGIDLVSDETLKTLNDYGVWGEKTMYGRKYMGVERTTFLIGRDGRIARIWRKVRVPGHAEEVLEAVRAL
ncbi:MAG: peroxiredoxin [Mesorhizobium sp. SCN 65-20]|nr:MAG: peroxiredoxin [Mesorhizobium sp. SCN 65-20]